jgi:hypothetical protein
METFQKTSDQETGLSLMGAYNRALGRIEKLQAIMIPRLSSTEEIEESTYDLRDETWRLWLNVLQKLFHQEADLSTRLATRSLRARKPSARGMPGDLPRRLVVDRPLPPAGLELDAGGQQPSIFNLYCPFLPSSVALWSNLLHADRFKPLVP